HNCDATAARPLLFSGVQEHDGEDEQHHNRARIDDHLDGCDELGSEQQVLDRQRRQYGNQRQGTVDRMPLGEEVYRPSYADGSEHYENHPMNHENSACSSGPDGQLASEPRTNFAMRLSDL